MNLPDDALRERRRSVAAEEAAALRAEVVRWIRQGEAGEEAAEVVRELVRDGLAEQVELALNSRDFTSAVGEQLRQQLAGRFADDLREAVVREVRRALADGVITDADLQELRRELRKDVRDALAGRPGPGGGLAPRGAQGWVLAAAAAFFVAAAGMLGGVWWMQGRAPTPAAQTARPEAPVAAAGGASTAAGDRADTPPPAPAGHPLLATWEGQVRATPPQGMEIGAAELSCWYPPRTREELQRLFVEAQRSRGNVEESLRPAFDPCVNDYAPAGGTNAAVFAAQAAVHHALALSAAEGWSTCVAPPSPPPDLDGFQLDGFRGNGTYRLLNTYLACRGVGPAVAFESSSDVTDYLFVTWLALQELSAR